MFPVYEIDDFLQYKAETLGSKEKIWLQPPNGHELPRRPHLFKIGRPGTGENWAEVVAYEIARTLHLPSARYCFAKRGEHIGVISEQFYPNNARFLPSNILLSRIIDGYDGAKKFRQIDYALNKILYIVPRLAKNPPLDCHIDNSLKVFIGYLVFDSLIGNTDRHHENWGIVLELEKRRITLAPTFDHASSLGRDETEERRKERLETADHRATVEAYAARGRSAFFNPNGNGKTLFMREMVEWLVNEHPNFTKFWAEQAVALSQEFFAEIFEQIPHACITTQARPFAMRLLATNQAMLREVALGR